MGDNEYYDKDFNILTQDFIYAVTRHLNLNNNIIKSGKILELSDISIVPQKKDIKLKAKNTDFIKKAKLNKQIGDLGELLALQYEKSIVQIKYKDKISHDAKNIGDGLGYDILSYANNGNKKYIEVKATKGNNNTPFYITASELKKSQEVQGQYYLYRIYNFSTEKNTGKLFIINGDLTNYCNNPVQYEVLIKVKK